MNTRFTIVAAAISYITALHFLFTIIYITTASARFSPTRIDVGKTVTANNSSTRSVIGEKSPAAANCHGASTCSTFASIDIADCTSRRYCQGRDNKLKIQTEKYTHDLVSQKPNIVHKHDMVLNRNIVGEIKPNNCVAPELPRRINKLVWSGYNLSSYQFLGFLGKRLFKL